MVHCFLNRKTLSDIAILYSSDKLYNLSFFSVRYFYSYDKSGGKNHNFCYWNHFIKLPHMYVKNYVCKELCSVIYIEKQVNFCSDLFREVCLVLSLV